MTESFPLQGKCPNCGSDRRLIPDAWHETHATEVNVPKLCLSQMPAVLADPHDLIPKGILILDDVCFDCGTRYIYRAEIVQGQVQVVEHPKKNGLLPAR